MSNLNDSAEQNSAYRFSQLSPAAHVLWAKSSEGDGHGLLAHMLDVAAAAEVLLEREPSSTLRWAARVFSLPETGVARAIAALVGLHDYGKAIPGFQCKWLQGQQRDEAAGLPFPRDRGSTDHSLASAVLLNKEFLLPHAPKPWLRAVVQAISMHHGHDKGSETSKFSVGSLSARQSWTDARRELLSAYLRAADVELHTEAEEIPLAAVAWLAGLTSTADWVASKPEWFPLGERAETLQGHLEMARERGRAALNGIGWPVFRVPLSSTASLDALLRAMLPDGADAVPRPLQQIGDRLLGEVSGPTLLLVEAPMGEGKTEMALLAHARLQARNDHRGFYFAMPTQATGDAIFQRALRFLGRYAAECTLDIQLAHGGAALNETVQRLRGVWDEEDRSGGIRSSDWFAQRRRPLLSPYGVVTVAQALLGILHVKHHFVRLWGLANRVVVLDEVHAYDTYTSGLIVSLLRWLRKLGCSVVLMSATLPGRARRELLEAWDAEHRQLPMPPYPRMLAASDAGVRGETFTCRPLAPIRVSGIGESLDDIASYALRCMREGGCGAIVVNTVNRAQKLYTLLAGQGVTSILFHARFPADERSARATEVLEKFGAPKGSGKRPRKALLIATQVAEQSLDVDFDFIISDLAPMDLLLQRAGRLHRHERPRPEAHQEARLTVAGLLPERLPETKETKWEFVYDSYILLRTWAWLARESVLSLPEDIDRLVQLIYDGHELPDGLNESTLHRIDLAYGKHRAEQQTACQLAHNATIHVQSEPQAAYADKPQGHEEGENGRGILSRTRLGDEGIAVVPVHRIAGGWSVYPHGKPFDPDTPVDDALAKQLLARRLSQKPLPARLGAAPLSRSFSEHPLLCHFQPLELTDGVAEFDSLRVKLDPVLGIVYENEAAGTVTS